MPCPFGLHAFRTASSRLRRVRLGLEWLEDRLTPSATINVGNTAADLISAIQQADNQGGATLILTPGATYKLTAVNNYWYGPNGLPAIDSAITIVGNGATIERGSDAGTPDFRLFYVSGGLSGLPEGSLTLQNVTLEGGVAKGGDGGNGGGGGMGAGGAIFNQGSVVLSSVTLTNNEALGGSGAGTGSGGGGGMGSNADASGNGGGFGGSLPGQYGGMGMTSDGSGTGGGGGGFLTTDNANFSSAGGQGGFGQGGDGGNGANFSGVGGGTGGNFGLGGSNGGKAGGGGGGIGGGGGAGVVGGSGGFGAGGGGGAVAVTGGWGGFGGGGGSGSLNPGMSGFAGGDGGASGGGGGAGLGGAIFNMGASTVPGSGSLTVTNCTLTANTVQGGNGGTGGSGGGGAGAAIFNVDGQVVLNDDTLDSNTVVAGTGGLSGGDGWSDGGAVYNLAYGNVIQTGQTTTATLTMNNSILSNTVNGSDLVSDEWDGSAPNKALVNGSTNLVMNVNITPSAVALPAGVITVTTDPQLSPLAQNGGMTPTMAISPTSSAYGVGNVNVAGVPATDQLGLSRLNSQGLDLGAYEFQTQTNWQPPVSPPASPPPAPVPPPSMPPTSPPPSSSAAPAAQPSSMVQFIQIFEDEFALTVDSILAGKGLGSGIGDEIMSLFNGMIGQTNPALGTGVARLQATMQSLPLFNTPMGNMAMLMGQSHAHSLLSI